MIKAPFASVEAGRCFRFASQGPSGPEFFRVDSDHYGFTGHPDQKYPAQPYEEVLIEPDHPTPIVTYMVRNTETKDLLEVGQFFDLEGADTDALVFGDSATRWACSDMLESIDRTKFEVVRVRIEVLDVCGPLRPAEYDE